MSISRMNAQELISAPQLLMTNECWDIYTPFLLPFGQDISEGWVQQFCEVELYSIFVVDLIMHPLLTKFSFLCHFTLNSALSLTLPTNCWPLDIGSGLASRKTQMKTVIFTQTLQNKNDKVFGLLWEIIKQAILVVYRYRERWLGLIVK